MGICILFREQEGQVWRDAGSFCSLSPQITWKNRKGERRQIPAQLQEATAKAGPMELCQGMAGKSWEQVGRDGVIRNGAQLGGKYRRSLIYLLFPFISFASNPHRVLGRVYLEPCATTGPAPWGRKRAEPSPAKQTWSPSGAVMDDPDYWASGLCLNQAGICTRATSIVRSPVLPGEAGTPSTATAPPVLPFPFLGLG